MGIELPPELAEVAAQAGVTWPEADEEAMADQAQAWRDTAKSMSTLATDADTTARSALAAISGDTGTAAATEWKTFVEPDTGHLTAVVRDANAAADRLEHAANQVGTAKVEIVRNLVGLAQNQDAANTAAAAGHPMALAGLDTAIRGTAANVANIESHLISAVQPTSGVDVAAIQNPVNANPGHHLLAGTTTNAVTGATADLVQNAGNAAAGTVGHVPGGGNAADLIRHGSGAVADTAGPLLPGPAQPDASAGTPGSVLPGDLLTSGPGAPNLPGPSHPADMLPGPNLPAPGHPADSLPGDPEITGPVPPTHFPGDAPTPPTGQTVQAGFAGGLEPSAAPAATAPPPAAVAPPLNPAAPALGGTPGFTGAPVPGAPPVIGAPPVGAPGGVPAAAPTAAPAPAQPARPAAYAPALLPADPAPRKQMAGPPGAPPPARGERNEVLAAFWMHMFPIGHLPVASYRPARQLQPPPPELDYAAGLRFEPGDHPQSHLIDPTARLADLKTAQAQHEAAKAAAEAQPVYHHYAPPPSASYPPLPPAHPAEAVAAGYPPAPLAYPAEPAAPAPPLEPPPGHLVHDPADPNMRPVTPSAGLTADHPTVQGLLENHDPLGGGHERDWDRRYLVRLGSVTAHGISPEGLEYNWPTSEQYPEGGSASGEPEVLEADTVIDRFGTPHGRVFAQDGTPFPQRSLPPAHKDTGYRRYKIRKPLPVWRAVSAAWFGQPGGGVRYRTIYTAAELVALGYLEEIA